MEEWLRAAMRADTAISAIVAERVDWEVRPAGDPTPGITLLLIDDVPELKVSGKSTWSDAWVQADCWGPTAGAAIRLRRAVFALCHTLRAESGGKKYRSFVIDASGRPEPDAARIVHRAQVDLRISYQL